MTVSTTTNKVSYSGNGSQTVFAYTFKIFADGDLTVIIRSSTGTETTKTLTTHYTVSGAGSSSGGNVTFTSGNTPASGDTVVIQRKLGLTQGTDYVANDPFPAESHEDALDRLTFITQQIQEEVDRSIKASVTNTISTTEFAVSATDRANKFFAFDSAGDLVVSQEIGTFRGNWAASTSYAQRDIVKDTSTNNIFIVNTAHTSSGAQPLTSNANSAKYDLLVDAATATSAQTAAATSETNAAASAASALSHKNDAETAKTASETAKTASETAKTAAELALTTFQDQYHGAAGSDPTSNLDAGDLYFNTSSGMKAYTGSAWEDVKPSSSEQTNINTLAAISSDVTSLANAIGAATTYAVTVAQSSGVNVFYLDGAAKPTLTLDRGNTYIFDQSDASNANHPLIFKDSGGNSYTTGVTVSGTAGQSGATVTIDVASNAPSALLYACSVHGNAMGNNITVVNSNLATVASNITSVNAVGTDIANVNSVGGSIANVNTVASNLTNVNAFADTYFVSATAPASPTTGDLWFDTSSNTMKVYGSSGFQNAGSSVNGTAQRSTFTATAGQTTFAATYDAGFVDVYLNGVKLIVGTDFTATNGTSVVLASGAAASDTVDIVAYGTFQLSNFSINDANDVNAAGASSGQFLKFDGTNFVADNVPAGVGGSNGVDFNDNVKARFGTGNDLEIYHDGNDSYVDDAGTGALILRGNSNVTIGKHTGETMGFFEADGAVSLYHDNSIKLATTSTGVSVTGNIAVPNGNGIDFSSTANGAGTTDSELLDFYEEGTWVPVPLATHNTSSWSITGYTSSGQYTRIGNVVFFWFNINITGVTGSSITNLGMNGLPFSTSKANNSLGNARNNDTGHLYNIEAISGTQIGVLRRYDNGSWYQGTIPIQFVGHGSYQI